MVFLADGTEHPHREVGRVMQKIVPQNETLISSAVHPSPSPVVSPATQADDNQHTGVKRRPAYLHTLSDCVNSGLFSRVGNVGASIYGDRRVPTLGRMTVSTEH